MASSPVEDRQVELAEALGVGDQINWDDLPADGHPNYHAAVGDNVVNIDRA